MSKTEYEFDIPTPLPDGWDWMPLEDLMDQPMQDIVDGPFGSNLKASEYTEDGIPIARLQNVNRNEFVYKNIKYVTKEKAKELSRHTFKPGDILITKLGDPLGEACIAPSTIGYGVIVADLVRVRPSESKVDRRYLAYAINSPLIERQFEKHTKGTTRPRVNLGMIRKLPIPVAPRVMHAGIVGEIEKQFSRLDEAIANLKRVKANLKRYKAAVLKAAVEGRLVETEASIARREGRSYETGEQLLQRILESRRTQCKGKGKYKEPAAPDTTELPELPDGWVWSSLNYLGDAIGGLTKNPKRAKFKRKLPYLRVANVYANELRLNEIEQIGVEDNELEKLLVHKGDLLIVEGNGSPDQIGRLAIWDGSITPCVHQNHLIKVRLQTGCIPGWAMSWLMSPDGRRQVKNVASSTSGLYTLSIGKISSMTIPLPPINEQTRIISEIERRLSIIHVSEAQVDVNLQRAERLRQSVLSSAFSGHLLSVKHSVAPSDSTLVSRSA